MKSVYFIGAGGIGMSALERYFLSQGLFVGGYDRAECPLTEELCAEGAHIHYEDNPDLIPQECKDKEHTLVVYTPAIPSTQRNLHTSVKTDSTYKSMRKCWVHSHAQ